MAGLMRDRRWWSIEPCVVSFAAMLILSLGKAVGSSEGARTTFIDRGRVLNHLLGSDLALESSLCSLLASTVPDSVAMYIADFGNPLATRGALKWLGLDLPHAGTPKREEAILVAATGQWTTSYDAVISRHSGIWRVDWDTVLAYALPAVVLDTIRLGIEKHAWPTLWVGGLVSAFGAQERIFMEWDGISCRIISPRQGSDQAIAGNHIEAFDTDGDGVQELVAWVYVDGRGKPPRENVFRYSKKRGTYELVPGLKSGLRPLGQRGMKDR